MRGPWHFDSHVLLLWMCIQFILIPSASRTYKNVGSVSGHRLFKRLVWKTRLSRKKLDSLARSLKYSMFESHHVVCEPSMLSFCLPIRCGFAYLMAPFRRSCANQHRSRIGIAGRPASHGHVHIPMTLKGGVNIDHTNHELQWFHSAFLVFTTLDPNCMVVAISQGKCTTGCNCMNI